MFMIKYRALFVLDRLLRRGILMGEPEHVTHTLEHSLNHEAHSWLCNSISCRAIPPGPAVRIVAGTSSFDFVGPLAL